jgi:hypothetical protein
MQLDAFSQTKELVRILKSAGPVRIQFFSRERMVHDDAQYAKLFRAISENPSASEADIARIAFGVGPKDSKYVVQRTLLKDMLMHSLFTLDVEAAGFSDFGVQVYDNDLSMLQTRILQSWSWPYSVKMALQSLEVALEYERWHNALLFLEAIREADAIAGDRMEFDRHRSEFERVLAIYTVCQQAHTTLGELMCLSALTTGEQPRIGKIAKPTIDLIRKQLQQYPCFSLEHLLWQLESAVYQSEARYKEAMIRTEDFEKLVTKRYAKFVNHALLDAIARKRLTCAFRIRDHVAAISALKAARRVQGDAGSLNWVMFKQLEFVLMMHLEDYTAAAGVVKEVQTSGGFRLIPPVHRGKWKIFEAYTRLALGTTQRFDRKNLDFRLQTDKAGVNAAAIVLEMLVLIRSGEMMELRDRYEAIDRYAKRYLGGEENVHVRRVIKLILLLVKFGSSRERFEERAAALLQSAKDDRSSDPVEGFQIIPFEKLWEWVLEWRYGASAER